MNQKEKPLTGLSRITVWRLKQAGNFPRRVRVHLRGGRMRTSVISVEPAKQPQPWVWSEVNRLRAANVVKVMNTTMRSYWPVGVCGAYYQVISLPGFKDAWYWRSQQKEKQKANQECKVNGKPHRSCNFWEADS